MIDAFTGKYQFLSNFFLTPVMLDGFFYPSVEHAFQAAKTVNPMERERVRLQRTPGKAKQVGRKVTLRPEWEHIKLDVMLDLLRQKFRHADLKESLLATGQNELVEGNWWGDTFWGVCYGFGENNLGKLLMQVRKELQLNE